MSELIVILCEHTAHICTGHGGPDNGTSASYLLHISKTELGSAHLPKAIVANCGGESPFLETPLVHKVKDEKGKTSTTNGPDCSSGLVTTNIFISVGPDSEEDFGAFHPHNTLSSGV